MTLQKLSHSYTKIGFKALQAKQPYILLIVIFFLCSLSLFAQEPPVKKPLNIPAKKDSTVTRPVKDSLLVKPLDTVKTDTTKTDSLNRKKPLLLDQIKRNAKDYERISQKDKKIYLYNEAEVYYQDTELKAGIIVIDYIKNEVYAGRIKDSAGNYTQRPYFKQGNNVVEPDSIRFNFDTEKALIWNSKSEQSVGGLSGVSSGGGITVKAEVTKKENDSVYYLYEGKLTTSENIDDPEYYIRVRKGKFVPKKKVIAGFSNMYIADVPTPIAVPFAYFPLTQSRTSGFIFPTFSQSNERGFFLQNGGYYFAISDYFDLALTGDYFTNGSFGVRAESTYALRYRFTGGLSFRFENNITSQRGFSDFTQQRVFNLRWRHTQDPKANPNSRFSASVNVGSSQFFRQSLNQLNNTGDFLQNTLSSSISYTKTFPAYPAVNISLTATHNQNTNTEIINLTLPTLQASVERIFPFAPKDKPKKGLLQNINFQYNLRGENRIQTTDSLFLTSQMFDDAEIGARHSIPINTNFKVAKYLSVSLNANYDDTWVFETIRRRDFDAALGEAPIDTIAGFDRFAQYSLGASLGTTLYGTFNFGEDKKIQAIRHVMRPSISWGYTPPSDRLFDEYIDENGEVQQFTRFENSILGRPSLGSANNIGINISNTLEAKVRSRDTTETEPKKISLLSSLNFNTAYNLEADSLRWSPLRVTGGTRILDNKMSINFGATLDPYAIDNSGRRINTFNIDNGGSLFRLTNANATLSYSLSNKTFQRKKRGAEDDDSGKSVEEDVDDAFFESGFAIGRNQRSSFDEDDDRDRERSDNTPYNSAIPWDLRIGYSFGYNNSNRQNQVTNNSIQFSGNVELSQKWRVRFSSSYDILGKGFGFTNLGFERDLDSWRMSFDWQPFRESGTWFFFIGIKGSILSDIKWEKRRDPDRRL
ncbi:LPS-assembly protein LptD [Leptobacterium flavescens]|uniref:LPS-assembly protein LptD n=1 Tax=Leptobacterium flavescens TaxID=472055 RepID=A0A6P0UUA3_9FLAO|nr:putative LPS assembly protein LptD [Leptobacterium flavescens]NER14006.1 LPS-assembly protein LptD [Leptobacterium flavescens]